MGREALPVLGQNIDLLDMQGLVDLVDGWATTGQRRYVCFCNVHSLVTQGDNRRLAAALADADVRAADGWPVAWFLRRLGASGQDRVSGPDFMVRYCGHAAQRGQAVYLYGSTPATLQALQVRLMTQWPSLRIVGASSPPFRTQTDAELEQDLDTISASGASVIWVSLGCPKQEIWMHRAHGRIPGVMLGVGAAFDFIAGTTRRAPAWMRDHGLEWFHRLAHEPRRLAGRYAYTNSLFAWRAAHQWLTGRC